MGRDSVMSSGAEAPRPLSSVLGSPNNKGGGIIERVFSPPPEAWGYFGGAEP